MQREQAIRKETELLLRRHNKVAKVQLKEIQLSIPDDILDILCLTAKKSEKQKRRIEQFRNETVTQLLEQSSQIHAERLQKSRRTREANLAKDSRYKRHFGLWINTTLPSAKISRDTYATIHDRSTVLSRYDVLRSMQAAEKPIAYAYIDETDGSVRYTPEYCLTHQKRCLQNFDINMQRFQALDHGEFKQLLEKFAKGRKFQEIHSLDEQICTEPAWDSDADIVGYVYIMVLDEYHQAYIGITETSVKNRITQHWRNKRAFDRLVFGPVESSVLSIDSFGPLDTTRIFVKPYLAVYKTPLEEYESKCIKAFDSRYLLNRIR